MRKIRKLIEPEFEVKNSEGLTIEGFKLSDEEYSSAKRVTAESDINFGVVAKGMS